MYRRPHGNTEQIENKSYEQRENQKHGKSADTDVQAKNNKRQIGDIFFRQDIGRGGKCQIYRQITEQRDQMNEHDQRIEGSEGTEVKKYIKRKEYRRTESREEREVQYKDGAGDVERKGQID